MKTLRDKVVVITGAGSGIGRALAEQAYAEGARLALCDWNEEGLAATASSLVHGSPRVLTAAVDVRSDADILRFRDAVAADVLVNNAGVNVSQLAAALERKDFEWVMDINFWGVVRGTEAFLPQLRRGEEAAIVNVSSLFGLIGVPSQCAYNASKFAVRGYTESLRQELRKTRVVVSCVHPGGVQTDIVANGRQYANSRGEATSAATLARDFKRIAKTSPKKAAATIWRGVARRDPRILVGMDAKVGDLAARMFPREYPTLLAGLTALASRALGIRV
jgi:NAD(P)-dependent dehydrogenase (short-subunit alcohol dehydrogenase family)